MALPNLVQIKQALDKMMPELSPVPIGSIAYAHEVPTGWLECNGAAISRTKYARLFKKIGTKYGAGDGSTTFNLPNLHHRVLEATTTISEVAKMVEAGLPDITGRFSVDIVGSVNIPNGKDATHEGYFQAQGAMKLTGASGYLGNAMGAGAGGRVSVQASMSSALYGKSSTNQNSALRLLAIIKI